MYMPFIPFTRLYLPALLLLCLLCPDLSGQRLKYKTPTQDAYQALHYNCNTAPVLTCPADITLCPGATINPDATGYAKAKPGSPACKTPNVRYSDRITSEGPCQGEKTVQRVWIAEDPDNQNLRSFCIQYIFLQDKNPPQFVACPPDITISSNERCVAMLQYKAPAATDDCGSVCMKSSHANGSLLQEGITRISFTATDDCGNTATCSFTVTVVPECCKDAPVIQCPADFKGCPGSDIEPAIIGYAIGSPAQAKCEKPIVSFRDDTLFHSSCSILIHRVWSATDPIKSDLKSHCVQKIELSDQHRPVIQCPADITVKSGPDCMAVVNWPAPVATDNCRIVNLRSNIQNGSRLPSGIHVIEYTAMDECGQTASCRFQVTVTAECCQTPPRIECPADFSGCPGSADPLITGVAKAFPGQAGCQNPLLRFEDDTLLKNNCGLTILRYWIARDPTTPSLRSSCIQRIELTDKTPPVVQCLPDITVQSGPDCMGEASWSDPVATDNCSGIRYSRSHGNGTRFPVGVTTVYYTIFDECENRADCSFTVTVEENCCNIPPQISCPPDFTGCVQNTDPDVTGEATALPGNVHCPAPVLNFRDEIIYQSNCSLKIARIWTAQDPVKANLKSSCIQIIEMKDEVAPRITCLPDLTVASDPDCIARVNWSDPAVEDNCSSVTISYSIVPGSEFPLGITEVVITAKDECNNISSCTFRVTVEDHCCNEVPLITCPPDFYNCPQSIIPEITGFATAVAGSAHCSNPLVHFTDDTLFNSGCSLRVIRNWIATDPDQETLRAECPQIIDLRDDQAPYIKCPQDITVLSDSDCRAIVNWSEPQISDNCTTPTIIYSKNPGSTFELGTTVVTATATDACGNSSSCTFNVIVEKNCCTEGPVITCPQDFSGCPGDDSPARTGWASADKSHPSCADIDLTYSDKIVLAENCKKIINRTWIARDKKDSTLLNSCIQKIILEDSDAPVFHHCPPDLTLQPDYNCEAVATWVEPDVTDACGNVSIHSAYRPGVVLSTGITRVEYTATDDCGNVAQCSFQITVTDQCCSVPPVIVCPADVTTCPGSQTGPEFMGTAQAEAGSALCEEPIISYRDEISQSGSCPGEITIRRIWKASDPQIPGLFSECVQTIELRDLESPTISGLPLDMQINAKGACEVEVNWMEPSASDDCGIMSFTSNYPSGTRFGSGVYVITYTARDICGKEAEGSFVVTVTNTEIGVVCPSDTIIYRTNPYQNGAIAEWQLPGVHYCQPCKQTIPGFIYMGEFNGNRYFCSLGPETWDRAKLISELNGGKLAIINDHYENQFVASRLNGQTAWIGGTDRRTEGRFEWIDNSPFSYTNWLPGQPNATGANHDYIEMFPDGSWNDQDGAEYREYVMEIPCYELRQISGPKRGELAYCGTHQISYVASRNGQSDTCTFNLIINCDTLTQYCKTKAQNSNILWIQKVEFSDINMNTGNNGGYGYFDEPCGNIKAGETYRMCLTPGFRTFPQNVYWKVWIDYNADGVFHNGTEMVTYGFGNTTMCAEIAMPAGFVRKQARMRVAMSYGSYPAGPCTQILYGEVEDYCVNLIPHTGIADPDLGLQKLNPAVLQCDPPCQEQSNASAKMDPRIGQDVSDAEFEILPNPANQDLSIQFVRGAAESFTVFNSSGKQVWHSSIDGHRSLQLDVSSWNDGVYHILVYYSEGIQISKRFVVQH